MIPPRPPFDLDAGDLAALCEECAPVLAGARITDVHQPWPRTVVLEARIPGRTLYWLVSATPGFCRAHWVPGVPPHRGIPPRLGQFLRARLVGKRIAALAGLPGERALRLDLEPRGDDPGEVRSLVGELFGARPNLIALDAAGTVLEALEHRVTRTREIAPGRPYAPLAAPSTPAAPAGRLEAARAARGDPSLSQTADALLGSLEAASVLEESRADLLRRLTEARKRYEGQRASLERAREETAGAERNRELGELIKANLHALRPGMSEARVADFYAADCPEVVVPLDPALPPLQNAERYFKKYRKAREGRETVARRLAQVARMLDHIAGVEARARAAEDPDTLLALDEQAGVFRSRAGRSAAPPRPRKKKDRRDPADEPRRYVSRDGLAILVGTSARQNDVLTLRLANGHDTWLHVEGGAGAHVVVRSERGKSVPLETLLDAATLAIYHSKFRAAGRASVTYTLRKHVSKPRHAPAGMVRVADPRRLDVRVERERLERLLEGQAGRDAGIADL